VSLSLVAFRSFAPIGALCLLVACSSGTKPGSGATLRPTGTAGSANINPGGTSGSGGGVSINVDGGSTPGDGSCTGLLCQIDNCSGNPDATTLSAKIYDPAGQVPLFDVAVYVPNSSLGDIGTGPTCDNCATPVSGDPVASALTDSNGAFTMKSVPAGTNIPLVIQIGKWRRQITIPEIKACQDNQFDDPTLFRLPKDQSEGHLPKIAIATGDADSLECLFRRIGVADTEFTNPDGPGRINLFYDNGQSAYSSGTNYPTAQTALWSTLDQLKAYDIVLMSCEGSESDGRAITTQSKQALLDYLNAGGRAFVEHYHYSWLRGMNEGPNEEKARKYTPTPINAAAPWTSAIGDTMNGVAEWATEADTDLDTGGDRDYQIDTTYPKGSDFADWLVNVKASTTRGTISLIDVKNPAIEIMPGAERWIYDANAQPGMTAVPYFSFNTPIGADPSAQCGRFVHTGIHVAKVSMDSKEPFPTGCVSAALTPQEKAMEFLLFDLSSCVQDISATPVPPVVPK
jgi:hypothetical protein